MNSLKVLLIQPPVRADHDPIDIPAALGILASISIQEGHQTALLDLNSTRPLPTWKEAADQIALENWDIIGIGGLSSMYKDIRKLIFLARKLHPNAVIVAGGGFITYMPNKIMEFEPAIDIACIGEGEETWREILRTYDTKDWKNIKGICYREDDQIIYTEPRPLIPDMDKIPWPAYDLIDLESYFKYSGSMWYNGAWKSKRRINFTTERGCPRQCTFCTHNGMNRWDQLAMLGDKKVKEMDNEFGFQAVTRFFSARYVVDHSLWLYEKYNVDYICLLDENLTSNKKRVHELCDLWIKEGLSDKIKLGTSGDSPSITPDVVDHMKQAGFTFIAIGGESGSDRVLLEDVQKGITSKHNQQAIDILKKGGIAPSMTFMVGNPHEDINDVLETVQFLVKNKVTVNPFICTPYPGTKLFMDYEDFILEQYDEKLSLLKTSPNPNITKEQIQEWKDNALRKFLNSLNNATDYSCTVSQKFDFADLIAIRYFIHECNFEKILKLVHLRGWKHDEKWKELCPVCMAENEILVKTISK